MINDGRKPGNVGARRLYEREEKVPRAESLEPQHKYMHWWQHRWWREITKERCQWGEGRCEKGKKKIGSVAVKKRGEARWQ